MHWNLDFEICGLAIMVLVLMLQRMKKDVPLKRNKMFKILLQFTTVSILVDIISSYMQTNQEQFPVQVVAAFLYLYYIVTTWTLMVYVYYIIAWTGMDVRKQKLAYGLYWVPCIVATVSLVVNFFTGFIFHYNSDGQYIRGDGTGILYLCAVYLSVYGIVYMILYGELIPHGKKLALLSYVIASLFAIILQLTYDDILFLGVGSALSVLILYCTVQNPGEILDAVTENFNRNAFAMVIASELKAKNNFHVLVLAMDDFKFVNKTFGIETGDQMLKQVGRYLSMLHPKGLAFRFGSDQFCLLLPEEAGDIKDITNAILHRFRHPWYSQDDMGVMLSTTICWLECPKDAKTTEEVIDVIDYSVLEAKAKGKGSVVSVKDLNLEKLYEEKAIEKAVKLAMDRDTLQVYYQPIYSIEKGRYNSAEALVRLKDENLGFISPEIFIPIAEKNGSIIRMGDMIFEKVCSFVRENDLMNTCIEYIEVNVSVVQCMQVDFVDKMIRTMEKYNIPTSMINLEITETAAINSANILTENMKKLTEAGIAFSLDDYGSGYSTLGYINQLPFKLIKLDKLIIWDAFENEKAGITLKHTVGMLKELEMRIVAEGVETEEQQIGLSKIGCDYLQGWYYSKAVCSEDFLKLIQIG